jgi:hypothetical protein
VEERGGQWGNSFSLFAFDLSAMFASFLAKYSFRTQRAFYSVSWGIEWGVSNNDL